jgi:uncharacterized repeat protein (TIGR03803 family)
MARPNWIFCTMFSLFFLLGSSIAQAQENVFTVNLLYSFSNTTDGAWPVNGLVFDSAGNLYGAASAGLYQNGPYCSSYGCGGIYEMTPDGSGSWTATTTIHVFHGSDGGSPYTNLILSKSGDTLFGTTSQGGEYGYGTVFQLSKASGVWIHTVIHNFNFNNVDGIIPGGLAMDAAGNLFGMTYNGGAHSLGTVYQLSRTEGNHWKEKILYSFSGGPDAAYPFSYPVYSAVDGSLYGTTQYGGESGNGTVFRLSPGANGSWTEKILFSFGGENGSAPTGPLLLARQGQTILGTTSSGGAFAYGAVFLLQETGQDKWAETVIHSFNNDGTDGYSVSGGLLLTGTGHLYGTTLNGGLNSGGIVYELLPNHSGVGNWTENIVHNFDPSLGNDGSLPNGILVFNKAGSNLLSTTQEGGPLTLGTVYQISASLGF